MAKTVQEHDWFTFYAWESANVEPRLLEGDYVAYPFTPEVVGLRSTDGTNFIPIGGAPASFDYDSPLAPLELASSPRGMAEIKSVASASPVSSFAFSFLQPPLIEIVYNALFYEWIDSWELPAAQISVVPPRTTIDSLAEYAVSILTINFGIATFDLGRDGEVDFDPRGRYVVSDLSVSFLANEVDYTVHTVHTVEPYGEFRNDYAYLEFSSPVKLSDIDEIYIERTYQLAFGDTWASLFGGDYFSTANVYPQYETNVEVFPYSSWINISNEALVVNNGSCNQEIPEIFRRCYPDAQEFMPPEIILFGEVVDAQPDLAKWTKSSVCIEKF